MIAKQTIAIPDLSRMTEAHVRNWLESLPNEVIYANYQKIHYALIERFGENVRVVISTYQSPKLIYVL